MANMADEYGTDVEIYTKALTTTIHADTLDGLQDLLEQLGLERHEHSTGEPLHVLRTVPDRLDSYEQKSLANRAIPALLAGHAVDCDPEVFDEAVYQQAVARTPHAEPTGGARQWGLNGTPFQQLTGVDRGVCRTWLLHLRNVLRGISSNARPLPLPLSSISPTALAMPGQPPGTQHAGVRSASCRRSRRRQDHRGQPSDIFPDRKPRCRWASAVPRLRPPTTRHAEAHAPKVSS